MENQIKVVDMDGKVVNNYQLSAKLLAQKPHLQSIFDVVISEHASKRQGTHSTLTKAEVSGGGRKPYKQKHTGRARQGSIRNPHYRHGGVVFGPKPNRNYLLKVNRKVFALAFCSALNMHAAKKSIVGIIDDLNLSAPSTKVVIKFLKSLDLFSLKTLFITMDKNVNLIKSVANLPKISCRTWNCVSPRDLLNYEYIVVQPSVLEKWMGVY